VSVANYVARHEHHQRRECQFAAATMVCLFATIAVGAPLALIVVTLAAGGVATHHGNRKDALEREEHGPRKALGR